MTALTNWTILRSINQSGNTLVYYEPDNTDNGSALAGLTIASGATSIVQMQCVPYTQSGETSSGELGIATNTNLYGTGNMLISGWREDGGIVLGKYNSGTSFGSASDVLNINGYIRIRTDGTTVYLEYSNDGSTWTTLQTTAQPYQTLYVQVAIEAAFGGNQYTVANIEYNNLT